MARIQSKRAGRKPPRVSIRPEEIRSSAEDALRRRGSPSRKWGQEPFVSRKSGPRASES